MKNVTTSLIINFKYSNRQCELTDRCVLARNSILHFVVSNETKNWWRYGLLEISVRCRNRIRINDSDLIELHIGANDDEVEG